MKSKVWTAVAIIIAIIIPFYANLLTAYPYPAGWSDDFRKTYGAEKGGAGRDLRFFDIAQDGDYFFVVHNIFWSIAQEGNISTWSLRFRI